MENPTARKSAFTRRRRTLPRSQGLKYNALNHDYVYYSYSEEPGRALLVGCGEAGM